MCHCTMSLDSVDVASTSICLRTVWSRFVVAEQSRHELICLRTVASRLFAEQSRHCGCVYDPEDWKSEIILYM